MAKNTEVLSVNPESPDRGIMAYAAGVIRKGGLVAFPTETVYGLGANALDSTACRGIFEAKGRPQDNPLIVHISDLDSLARLVPDLTSNARNLARAFWPGPLTIVVPKPASIPYEITAGLNTVGIRIPAHPVALALIQATGTPIAAPSANASGRPSPTRASHVLADLGGKIDLLIDGGPCGVGVESTVIDVTDDPPVVLRPGGLSLEQICSVIPGTQVLTEAPAGSPPRSPGLLHKHYAPKAELWLFVGSIDRQIPAIASKARELLASGLKVGLLVSSDTLPMYSDKCPGAIVAETGPRDDMPTVASRLFDLIRSLDNWGVDVILAESYPDQGIGLAVMNRLTRAALGRIVNLH